MISREWYRFLLNLFSSTEAALINIDELQLGPPQENTPVYAELLNIIDQIRGTNQDASVLATLQNEIQSLAVGPPSIEIQSLTFGSFTRSTGATATAINTPQTVSFESQDLARGGIAWDAGTPTRIYVYTPGTYNFQFSAQATKSSASLGYMWIWPAISGTDVPNSSGRVSFQGSNSDLIAAWNWFLPMNAGDYFELKWAVDDLNIVLVQDATPAFGPDIPAVILTANRVSL